jgi:hypothetical protein
MAKNKTFANWDEVKPAMKEAGLSYDTVWARWRKGERRVDKILAPPRARAVNFLGSTYKVWAQRVTTKYGIELTGEAFGSSVARWRRLGVGDMEILERFDKRFRREVAARKKEMEAARNKELENIKQNTTNETNR